jgi:hypothetical protein
MYIKLQKKIAGYTSIVFFINLFAKKKNSNAEDSHAKNTCLENTILSRLFKTWSEKRVA